MLGNLTILCDAGRGIQPVYFDRILLENCFDIINDFSSIERQRLFNYTYVGYSFKPLDRQMTIFDALFDDILIQSK